MTTVLHQDFEKDRSIAFLFHCTNWLYSKCSSVSHGVAASSLVGLRDRVLVFVVTPFLGSGYVILHFQHDSVKFFHIRVRACAFDLARQ